MYLHVFKYTFNSSKFWQHLPAVLRVQYSGEDILMHIPPQFVHGEQRVSTAETLMKRKYTRTQVNTYTRHVYIPNPSKLDRSNKYLYISPLSHTRTKKLSDRTRWSRIRQRSCTRMWQVNKEIIYSIYWTGYSTARKYECTVCAISM